MLDFCKIPLDGLFANVQIGGNCSNTYTLNATTRDELLIAASSCIATLQSKTEACSAACRFMLVGALLLQRGYSVHSCKKRAARRQLSINNNCVVGMSCSWVI